MQPCTPLQGCLLGLHTESVWGPRELHFGYRKADLWVGDTNPIPPPPKRPRVSAQPSTRKSHHGIYSPEDGATKVQPQLHPPDEGDATSSRGMPACQNQGKCGEDDQRGATKQPNHGRPPLAQSGLKQVPREISRRTRRKQH